MLEVLLVWSLAKHIGSVIEKKGHKAGWYQFLLVFLWIGGEVAGAFIGAVIIAAVTQREPEFGWVYLSAIIGAASGAGIVFALAYSLPDIKVYQSSFGTPDSFPGFAPDQSFASPEADDRNPYRPPQS